MGRPYIRNGDDLHGDIVKIGKRIKKYRLKSNMTQRDLSKIIGYDHTALSLFESGNRCPSLSTIKKIADALSIPVEELTDSEQNALDIQNQLNEKLKSLDSYIISAQTVITEILEHLKYLRRIRLITLKDVAKELGCTTGLIWQLENKYHDTASLEMLINFSKRVVGSLPEFISHQLRTIQQGTK
jgi:transcriptional regulator with XRE-family HTH domain